jgi:hypothetical protein
LTSTIDHTQEIPEVPAGADPGTAAAPPDAPRRRVQYRSAPSPWRRSDVVLCLLLGGLGVAGIVACWWGATDEVIWRKQSGWLIGAILCTGLVVVAGGIFVLLGMRRVRQGFRDLRRDQRALGLTRRRGAGAPNEPVVDGALVTAPQMTRVHRPNCILLRGKAAAPVPVADLDNYGRCGVCNS